MTKPVARFDGPSAAPPDWFVEPSLGQRFLGSIIDSVVLLPVSAVYLVEWNLLTVLLVLAARAVYEISLTARTGRTVGKLAMGTAALDAVDGSVISVPRATTRWLVLSGLPGALLLVASPLGALYSIAIACSVLPSPLHRGFHDRAARTLVTSLRTER